MKNNLCIIALNVIIVMMFHYEAGAQQTGTPVYGRVSPSEYDVLTQAHKGAGTFRGKGLLNPDIFKTNLLGISRASIPPGASIGEHVHRHMEEVFIILNAPAQFTRIAGQIPIMPARRGDST